MIPVFSEISDANDPLPYQIVKSKYGKIEIIRSVFILAVLSLLAVSFIVYPSRWKSETLFMGISSILLIGIPSYILNRSFLKYSPIGALYFFEDHLKIDMDQNVQCIRHDEILKIEYYSYLTAHFLIKRNPTYKTYIMKIHSTQIPSITIEVTREVQTLQEEKESTKGNHPTIEKKLLNMNAAIRIERNRNLRRS
jgi:hypothetical protein